MQQLTAKVIFVLNAHACTCTGQHCLSQLWRVTWKGTMASCLADKG